MQASSLLPCGDYVLCGSLGLASKAADFWRGKENNADARVPSPLCSATPGLLQQARNVRPGFLKAADVLVLVAVSLLLAGSTQQASVHLARPACSCLVGEVAVGRPCSFYVPYASFHM